MQADFRSCYGMGLNDILHSAKGTTWKNHKYIKKENGRYIYPGTQMAKSGSSMGRKANNKMIDNELDELNKGYASSSKKIDELRQERTKLVKALNDYKDELQNKEDARDRYGEEFFRESGSYKRGKVIQEKISELTNQIKEIDKKIQYYKPNDSEYLSRQRKLMSGKR